MMQTLETLGATCARLCFSLKRNSSNRFALFLVCGLCVLLFTVHWHSQSSVCLSVWPFLWLGEGQDIRPNHL